MSPSWLSATSLTFTDDYRLRESEQLSWYSKATPTFAIGHGLTYATVSRDALRIAGSLADDDLIAHLTMTNHSNRPARELALITADGGPEWGVRPVAWTRLTIEPNSSTEVAVRVPSQRLRQWSPRHDRWSWPAQGWTLFAGASVAERQHCVNLAAPEQVDGIRGFPLEAWKADAHDGVVGVASDTLAGTAVAGRPTGRMTWTNTEAATQLVVRARQPHGAGGTIKLLTSEGARAEVEVDPDTPNWRDFAIELGLTTGGDLTAELAAGVELDRIMEP